MKHLFVFLALMCALTASAKKDRYTRVYMFGVATTFVDSTVVMTDIMAIDSAFVTKKDVLSERVIYSYQLEDFLEKNRKKPGATVAVYWSFKRKDVEKEYLRIRKRFLDDKTTRLQALPQEEFTFKAVEHFTD